MRVDETVVSALQAACEYAHRGFAVVPIPHGEKAPRIANWPALRLSESELPAYFSDSENVGLILGRASGGLIDVDVDCREAALSTQLLLPRTERIHGRENKRGSHFWYIADPVPAPKKFSAPDGTTLVELRSDGQQTVVPPSVHPSGETMQWECAGEPARVDGAMLSRAVAHLAAAALLVRHWPAQGRRNDVANALAGMLLRAGFSENEAEHFVGVVAEAAGDEEVRQRVRDVVSTAKRLMAGQSATGTPTLASIFGDEIVRRMREWLGFDTRVEVSSTALSPFAPSWPESLAPEAFHGPAGEFVRGVEGETESDLAALLIQFLVCAGSILGPSLRTRVGGTEHGTNLFALIVGETAKARKGTSFDLVKQAAQLADSFWAEKCIAGGLSSGEGVIWAVRDEVWGRNKKGECVLVEEGISDKRLLIVETEFSSALRVMQRDGNTLSPVLRQGWDRTNLRTLTKNAPAAATRPHVSIIAHVTERDLMANLSATDQANGFANRFLIGCVRRARLLPEGGKAPADIFRRVAQLLAKAREFAANEVELQRDEGAIRLWGEVYPALTEGTPDLFGAVTARAEAQVLRLSLLYAALDLSPVIARPHLLAALAVWDFCRESAWHVFGARLGDPVADRLLAELSVRERMSREEMRDLFGRNLSGERIERALELLEQAGRAERGKEKTGGRPVEIWSALRRKRL